MNREAWPGVHDPELDLPVSGQGRPMPAGPIDGYRRILANPMLSALVSVLAIMLIRSAVRRGEFLGFFFGVGFLLLSFLFIQFHCLDCGATGWARKLDRHACPHAVARWHSGRRGWLVLPSLRFQLTAWAILLLSAGVLFLILFVLSY